MGEGLYWSGTVAEPYDGLDPEDVDLWAWAYDTVRSLLSPR